MAVQQLQEGYSRTDQTRVSELLAKRDIHEALGVLLGRSFWNTDKNGSGLNASK